MGDEAGSGSGRHAGFRGSQGIEGALPRAGTRLPLAKPLPGRGPEGALPRGCLLYTSPSPRD
ncbi:hypothetical protein FA373_21555, partial [Pseudomonas aeruginosa]|nr:hypothetical protein [Pseudomonas aeruginosa]